MAPGAERVLTRRELNRTLLERQFLLKRRKLAIPRALERIGGIQAQYAPSMYIGLWARLAGFERDQLTRALERRTVVQGTLLRSTIHLVSREDYWPMALAIRDARRSSWLRYQRGRHSEAEVEEAARLLRGRMEAGQSARKELIEGIETPLFNGAQLWIDIVRVPPSGTWERRRADRYGLAEEWIAEPPHATAAEGRELLVRRYLQGFGPGAPKEVADWAGLPVAVVSDLTDAMELRHFRDEAGGLLVDLPRLAIASGDAAAPARFLPTWDATLLVHARRTQILPEEYRPKLFNTKTPQSMESFTVDGQVAGSWKWERGRVRLSPFGRLAKADRAELEDEAERLALLHR
jgi:hypothetical protein